MRPALNTAKGQSDHLSHPSARPLHTSLPSPHKKQALPFLGERARETCLFSLPHCHNRGPKKALPEFLVWSGSNCCRSGKAKNAGGSYRKEWGLFMNLFSLLHVAPQKSGHMLMFITQPTHPPGSADTPNWETHLRVVCVATQSRRRLGKRVTFSERVGK